MDNFPAFLTANASLSMFSFADNSIETGSVIGVSMGADKMIASKLARFNE